MAPGSTTSFTDSHSGIKQYVVVHEASEQFKVVGSYPTEEEAYAAALDKQIDVFSALKDSIVKEVLRACPERSMEWKLRMLQDAMESYFMDVGFEALTDFFTVTDQPITDGAPKKRKMAVTPRGETKLAKSNTSCGIVSTARLRTMATYMYQTSPFGLS
ncbi:hypothetical protein M758_6G201200 [Ceratodon purpureus]|nr:hypothetical protein M758_6G201200 [Ceratodon purpureus]